MSEYQEKHEVRWHHFREIRLLGKVDGSINIKCVSIQLTASVVMRWYGVQIKLSQQS